MNQLRFDINFKKIIKDIPFWKNEEDIPLCVKEYFQKSLPFPVIYNSSTRDYCCFYCMRTLDENYECKACNKNYKDAVDSGEWKFVSNTKEQCWHNYYHGFVFDVINQDVFLYVIDVDVSSYFNDCAKENFMHFNYDVAHAYFIQKNGILDLTRDEEISFDDYYKNQYANSSYDESILGVLYTENLDLLQTTIYQYTYLWNAKEYLEMKKIDLCSILFVPLYFSGFEYLMKENLLALAFDSPKIFKKNKSFCETFGVSKKFLPFIKKYNMSYDQVKILSMSPTYDISFIHFFSKEVFCDSYFFDLAKKLKLNLQDVKEYLEGNGYENHIWEYVDYLDLVLEFGLNLKSKKILYPVNLLLEHNKLYLRKKCINDPLIGGKIEALAKVLSINQYEDEKYVIYPASSMEALMDEGVQQHNCVCTYCEKIAKNYCQIYFMRKKEKVNESFVTVEVMNNKVVQAKAKYNELPSKDVDGILKKWEQKLIPVFSK